jgi:O-antigen ligase
MTAALLPPTATAIEFEPTPMLKAGFCAFCVFLFALFSRFFEWKLTFLHVPLVTSSIALLGAALDGRLLAMFRNRIGVCMAMLTILYAATIPFSAWRGGSFYTFNYVWLKSLTTFLIAGALVVTFKQCRAAVSIIGWAAGIASLLTLALGKASLDGRLALSEGTLGNPNDIARILLLGLPFLWLMVIDRRANKLKRLIAFGLTATSLLALIRTGSRTGLIGLFVLCLIMFFRASMLGKVVVCFCVIVGGTAAIVAFPSLVQRYETLFMGEGAIAYAHTRQEASSIDSAVASSDARRQLLIESLKATATHPILGVGIGAFGPYEANKDIALGLRANYQGTHNTYTQVSSEAGIPAFIVFICIVMFVFSDLIKVFKRARRSQTQVGRQVAGVSFALIASLAAYAIYIFFDFVAYDVTLPILSGFAIALTSASTRALLTAEAGKDAASAPVQIAFLPPRRRAQKAI